jgi:hypothetical protein
VTSEPFAPGGYRFIPAVFQYSAGVAAERGHAIERVALRAPIPLGDGFGLIEKMLREAGRPLTALCACELRSPKPFTDATFRGFNEAYVARLAEWGIYNTDTRRNPVARSNVCPERDAPPEPCLYAFSFTVRAAQPSPTFVVAGSGEAREGGESYRARTVRWGETSPEALREKAGFVVAEMERRLHRLGVSWADTSATQAYSVHDIHPFLADLIVARGAARHGLTWHLARPPVEGLEFEMDCRAIAIEHLAP